MKLQIWLFTILTIFQYNHLSLQTYVFYFIHLKTLFGKEPGKGVDDTLPDHALYRNRQCICFTFRAKSG